MKPSWKSLISLFLVLVFVFQLFPASVLAVETEGETSSEEETISTAQNPEEAESVENGDAIDAFIVGEVEDLREESVKHFRMSDGSFTMVQYSKPVHFQDASGLWKSIDNTLVEREGRFVSENGAVKKSFASSMEDGELLRISYGDYSVGMSYIVPASADKPIQTSLPDIEASGKATPEQTNEPHHTNTPEAAETDEQSSVVAVTPEPSDQIEDQEQKPEDVVSKTSQPIDEQTTPASDLDAYIPVEGTTYAVHKNSQVKAKVENASQKAIANIPVSEALAQVTASSKVQFVNADGNIDLVYENCGYDIKESILIHSQQEQYTYAFELSFQGLKPELQEDGSILLRNEKDEEIFMIPAPFLVDAKGVTSNDAKYTLANISDHWILTVDADSKWMNANDRSFPVQLDPSIITKYGSNTVYSTYVRSLAQTATGTNQEMYCGYNVSRGECRVALQITQLPTIPTDCTPVAVGIAMYHAAYYNSSYIGSSPPSTPILIEVHELDNGITNISSQTWETLAPKVISTVIDYQKGTAQTIGSYLQWDISSAGLNWYANGSTDRGLIFIAPNAQSEQQTANLYGSHYMDYCPALVVEYRSAVGIENYYSYQQASAGRAGDVSINDFTNQMTVFHTDLTYNSEATPFELYHVYNSERANQQFSSTTGVNTRNFTAMVVGSGWKLSAQQTIISKVIGDTTYLVYNDEDGTDHYFQKTAYNKYEDEDGLNLTIEVNGSTYTMTDQDANNTWTFYNGFLISHEDIVGNMIYYAYNSYYSENNSAWKPNTGSGNQLVQIVSAPVGQSATTICTFGYTGWFLTSMTDYANRVTQFSIQGENGRNILKYIQHTDGTQARYEYNADAGSGRMQQIYDAESGYGLTISERVCQGKLTVNEVREFTAPSVYGTKPYGNGFHAFRNSAALTSYRFFGPDHTKDGDNGGDDTILYSVLDNWGKTICSYETDSKKETLLGVESGSYTTNTGTSKTNNRLTSASALGLLTENILSDVGLEYTTTYWHPLGTSGTIATAQHIQNGANTHTGKGSLFCKLSNAASNDQTVSFYQDMTLVQGKTYVFSGYINTSFTTVPSIDSGAYLQIVKTSNGQTFKSDIINYSTSISNPDNNTDYYDGGWEKVSVAVTPPSTASYRLSFVLRGAKGSAYADDFQLERRGAESLQNNFIGASSTNLLTHGSFDGDFPEYTYNWTGDGFQTAPSGFLLGTRCAETTGNTGAQRRLWQTVPINRNSSDLTFVLSGWGKADSIASAVAEPSSACLRYFGLIATINYVNAEPENHYVSFSPDYSNWQYASGNIVPKLANTMVESITVSCAYDYNANTAKFDNISLVREPMQTYSYGPEGELISTKDGNAKSSVTYISGTHRPSTYKTPSGIAHTLTYTSNKLLATDSIPWDSTSNLVTTNSYNSAGSLLSQTVKNTNDSYFLKSQKEYSADSHFLTKSTDANGVDSIFTNNAQRNLDTAKIGGNDVQSYGYFTNSDRIQQTYVSGKASIFYTYGSATLTKLQRKSFIDSATFYQRYNYTNDSFGNNTKITVSGSTDGNTFSSPITLVSYAYESNVNNGRLKSKTWPNGDKVTYSYDMFDRVTNESYTGTETKTVSSVYDGMGNLASKTATQGGQTEKYAYQYDGLGRLYHSRGYLNGIQTISTSYQYDLENRLKLQQWSIGTNVGFTESYNYSATDGTLSSLDVALSIPNGSSNMSAVSAEYVYTPVSQIQKKTIHYANADQFYRAFSYKKDYSTNQTSNQIEYMNYRYDGGALIQGQKNSYDSSGRLLSFMPTTDSGSGDANRAVTYTYNTFGQLKKCVDKSGGITVTYTYNYDTAGNILSTSGGGSTKTYYYENASWKDLLTKIKIGNTTKNITYTTPGLPDNWYNGSDYTFTWKHGTQLATVVKDNQTTTYSYDMDGIRNGKTVGSTAYHFDTLSGKVMHQTGAARELWFIYDENGEPYMLLSKQGSTVKYYWYLLNTQGDVVGILNQALQKVAMYRYDPYGKVVYESTSYGDDIGTINPLRYRGYFYDFESGLYYLQSRYYDPVIGRFISADCFETTEPDGFLNCNMFAYCENDPVNHEDADGTLPKWATKVIIGTAVIAAAAVLTVATAGTGTAVACFAVGALQGSITGAAIGAAQGAVTGAVAHRIATGSWKGSGEAALNGAADGYLAGAITGFITGGLTSKACFVAGTAVLASTGYVAIENVKAGDYVWAWDEETGDTALKQVVETYINETTELVHVYVNGEEIVTTPTHPFYSPVKGWTSAIHLRAGDILVLVNGEYVIVEQVQHELLEAPIPVYNFQVEGYHTYYVANCGVLVHNSCNAKYNAVSREGNGLRIGDQLTKKQAIRRIQNGQDVLANSRSAAKSLVKSAFKDGHIYSDIHRKIPGALYHFHNSAHHYFHVFYM